ncbi:MAG: DUF4258 domain-containing protein [Methanosarcinaceae archaeon]|nr:DUF4258 domain-containing protein [Methanosarcinaceae archaeon]
MSLNHNHLKHFLTEDAFIISNHARVRMFQRNISTEDIIEVILQGQIIEDYSDDEPCPSALFFANSGGRACHVVAAECEDHVRIITVYIPENDKWIDYIVRREQNET